ncbi:hypothetical protein WJX84_001006 [Apatococcus fuscideae]|uniref:RING-type E3 ubiquitin transferase n=1 Tax=Apatococcus fuscideae TaxID=2026836 RepID=A0AAW1SRX1_9CHLO
MARDPSSVPSKRALRPRQEVDYTRKVEGNAGTNTPTWVKAGTSKAKETLRHRAARQSLSKRGKSLPAAVDNNRKQRGKSGGQNQPPSPPLDAGIQDLASRDSASSKPCSASQSAEQSLHVLTKTTAGQVSKPSQQQDRKSRGVKRHTAGPLLVVSKRQRSASSDQTYPEEAQPAQPKAARRGKLQKLSQANKAQELGATNLARYDELKRGRIEEVEAVLEANRRAASNKIASLEAACEGWKAEAHRQQQRVESLNPEGFRSQILQWRKQAMEEQQRFKQRTAAYKARIQLLETQLNGQQFRPAPQVASDKWSASPSSPEQLSAAPEATPLDEFPGPPLPVIVPYSISARVDCNTANRPLVAYIRGALPTGGASSERRSTRGRPGAVPSTRASAPRRRSRFFTEAVEGQGLLSNPEPKGEEVFEGFGHVRQVGPAVSPSSPVTRSPQRPWDGPQPEGSHSVAVSNVTSRPSHDEQMYPLQLHFSPRSPHIAAASPRGSPAARPSRSAQGKGNEHEVRSALESLVGLQAHPVGPDTLRFCHGSGFEFELGPASPSESWATGPEGIPNTRYLPLNLGLAAQPPEDFCCPITGHLMRSPVTLVESYEVYDKKNLEEWFAQGNNTDPLSGVELTSHETKPNVELRTQIVQWLQESRSSAPSSPAKKETKAGPPAAVPVYPDIRPPEHSQTFHYGGSPPKHSRNSSRALSEPGTPMSLYESLPDDHDGPPVAYPHMVGHDPAPDNLAQVSAVLRRLESPNNDLDGFHKGASYALWQLRELAGDAACREEIVSQGGLAAMIRILQDDRIPDCQAYAASVLKRLCGHKPELCLAMEDLGAIQSLVHLLASPEAGTRAAGAAALAVLGRKAPPTLPHIFNHLCAAGHSNFGIASPIVMLRSSIVEGKAAEEGAAACALHSLTDGMPGQQYKSLLCSGTGVLPALVKTLESQSTAVEYATSRALINLARVPGNQQEIVNALFNQMLGGSRTVDGMERACRLLWELPILPNNAINPGLAATIASSPQLLPALQGLMGMDGSPQARTTATGLVQMLVHEDKRVSNSIQAGPNYDSLRHRIVFDGAVMSTIAGLLEVQGRHSSLIAAHAIANLAAFRSGYDEVPQSRLLGAAPAPAPTPRLALASNPEIASGLAALLAEENVASASAALAALYNLTTTEGSMEALRARLKSQGLLDRLRDRLAMFFNWTNLPQRTKDSARMVLQRLERKDRNVGLHPVYTLLLPPPPLQAVWPSL